MTPRCRRIPQCKSGSSWATEWDATLQRSPALLASLSRHFRRGAHLGTACRGEAGKFRRRPESPLMGLGYSEPIRLSAGGLFGVALHSRAPDGAETRHRPAAWFVHVRSQYSPPAGKSGSRTPSASLLMPCPARSVLRDSVRGRVQPAFPARASLWRAELRTSLVPPRGRVGGRQPASGPVEGAGYSARARCRRITQCKSGSSWGSRVGRDPPAQSSSSGIAEPAFPARGSSRYGVSWRGREIQKTP